MVSLDTLKECFDEFGIEPSVPVLNKCIEICANNDVTDAIEFVETWMAYSVSKLGGAEPTVEHLLGMQSHEYSGRNSRYTTAASSTANQKATIRPPDSPGDHGTHDGLVVYNNRGMDSAESEVLGSYGCVTPKAQKPVSRLHESTPRQSRNQFSPASYSPISSKRSQLQDGPNNSGNVVYTYGNGQLLKQVRWSSDGNASRAPLSIEVSRFNGQHLTGQAGNFMSEDWKYMFDSSYERVLILGDRIYDGGRQICSRLAKLRREALQMQPSASENGEEEFALQKDDRETMLVEEVAIHHVDHPSTDAIAVMGRIVVNPEQKHDRLGIVDFDEMTLRYTKLDFSKMKAWSVFPGETVVLEGINPRGNVFEVQGIHYERPLELPRAPPRFGRDLNMVIAAGPFTDKEDLAYEKLSDLLTYCSNNYPDVLILTGPFGDSSNAIFSAIAETFEEYFEKIIMNIMSSVPSTTEVLVVANHDDIMSMFVYPCFPYTINTYFPNLRFLPDPCVVTINGLEIGITSTDTIKHLCDAEVTGSPRGDKIKRAFNYLFHHMTFYPLDPPSEDVPLDLGLLNSFGKLPRVPNMMVCPGDLKCYIRDVQGCVCVNPGRLSDQTNGEGTFARVHVHPPESETASPFNYVVCQVVKS